MAVTMSSLSTEYIRLSVNAIENGAQVDPTGTAPDFAFMPDAASAEPGGGDWNVGEWETDSGPPIVYYARILVGPGGGGVNLSDGKYDVWIRLNSSPEIPIRQVGVLTIT